MSFNNVLSCLLTPRSQATPNAAQLAACLAAGFAAGCYQFRGGLKRGVYVSEADLRGLPQPRLPAEVIYGIVNHFDLNRDVRGERARRHAPQPLLGSAMSAVFGAGHDGAYAAPTPVGWPTTATLTSARHMDRGRRAAEPPTASCGIRPWFYEPGALGRSDWRAARRCPGAQAAGRRKKRTGRGVCLPMAGREGVTFAAVGCAWRQRWN